MMRSAVDLGAFGRDRTFGARRADAVARFQWLSNTVDSVFSFATGIVDMPAVQLPGDEVFAVSMQRIPGSDPLTFPSNRQPARTHRQPGRSSVHRNACRLASC